MYGYSCLHSLAELRPVFVSVATLRLSALALTIPAGLHILAVAVDRSGRYSSPISSTAKRFAATLGELTGGRVGLTAASGVCGGNGGSLQKLTGLNLAERVGQVRPGLVGASSGV